MDTAFCTIDNTSYDIATFSGLDDKTLSTLRRALVCQKCHAQGYYRKKSRDGKPACFGAYHEDDCEYKTKGSASRLIPEAVEEVNAISTNDQVIDIAFGFLEADNSQSSSGSKPNTKNSSSDSSRQHTQRPVQKRNASRGLKSLLRMLMHTDSFASSDIEINTGSKHPFKAKNLFIHFDDVDARMTKWRGYWGIISHADPKVSWLNVANKKEVSVLVSGLKEHILKMYKIDSHEELAGASVLVFGRLNISENGKWYIKVDDDNPQHLFVKIRRY